jgi:hypothetical protein
VTKILVHRKYESKGQVFARKAVALASSGGGWNPLEGLEQAYRNVDHEIDDGGRLRSRLEKVHAKQTNRRELLKAKLRETVSLCGAFFANQCKFPEMIAPTDQSA